MRPLNEAELRTIAQRFKLRPNVQHAFAEWKSAGDAADASGEALFRLGLCYFLAIGTSVNAPLAVQLLERASQRNNANASNLLGCIYYRGYGGVGPNVSLAFKHWLTAAEADHYEAAEKVSECYKLGEGVGVDELEHRRWEERAAELGARHTSMFDQDPEPDAPVPHTCTVPAPQESSSLSECSSVPEGDLASWRRLFESHDVVAHSPMVVAVCSYLEKICQTNEASADSLCLLAYAYSRKLFGVAGKNPHARASVLYRKAANEFKSALAAFELAKLHEEGNGVMQNPKDAFRLYHRAAVGGYEAAYSEVARCYEQGFGVKRDAQEAARWRSEAKAVKRRSAAALHSPTISAHIAASEGVATPRKQREAENQLPEVYYAAESVADHPHVRTFLQKHRLKHVRVPSDGDCLFHALAVHCNRGGELLRQQITDFIEIDSRGKDLREALQETNTSIEHLRHERVWGGEEALIATALLERRRVIVIAPDQGSHHYSASGTRISGAPDELLPTDIILLHNGINHYDSLVL